MLARLGQEGLPPAVRKIPGYFTRPVQILRAGIGDTLRADLIAGATVGVILLPQSIAYALVADLPPTMGIYAAIVGGVVGSLFGSSNHLQTGPTNAASLLVLTIVLSVAEPGSPGYFAAAGLLAVMAGVIRLLMGLARLGVLVNFVSDSVIVGFTAGAGILISAGQIRHLFRLNVPNTPSLTETLQLLVANVADYHLPSLLLGVGTILLIMGLRRFAPKVPAPLTALAAAAALVILFRLDESGVRVIGDLPRGLPPFTPLPIFNTDLLGQLATGALAIAALGLVEATAIARSIAAQSGQRLDNNQEFVGQGIAAIAAGFLSGYPISGSFTRSAVNFRAGAKSPMAGVYSGLFVLVAIFVLAPAAAFIPTTALAGVLIVTAYGMVDIGEMQRIWRSTTGNGMIMVVTLLATLLLKLQFAVLSGIVISMAHYLVKTSTPRVLSVLPDEDFRHLIPRPELAPCPQLGILDIRGNLYFGAVNHVEEQILERMAQMPAQRYLLLTMHSVSHCDMSGIYMLESIVRTFRDRGGDVFIMRVQKPVQALMQSTGFDQMLGADHFLHDDAAIHYIFTRVLDPAICIYECPVRAFRECQNLPKQEFPADLPRYSLETLTTQTPALPPRALWQALHLEPLPYVADVREPREYRQGHVPGAHLLPLSKLLQNPRECGLPHFQPIVLACRTGRRSERAAALLRHHGFTDISILEGGMVGWESEGLLEALGDEIDEPHLIGPRTNRSTPMVQEVEKSP